MTNIDLKKEGTTLTITIDSTQEHGPSKSGKSTTVASTGGNVDVGDGVKLGLNCHKSIEAVINEEKRMHTFKTEDGTNFNYSSDFSGDVEITNVEGETIHVRGDDILIFVGRCYIGPAIIDAVERADW